MKKIFLILFLCSFCFPIRISAQVIQTGDAKAETKVETNVSGGDTYTKIEVEVNGKKEVLETTEPGAHSLELKSNGEVIIETPSVSPSAVITPIDKVKKSDENRSIINNLKHWLVDLFNAIGFFFKLDK